MTKELSEIIHGRVNVQIGKNGLSNGVIEQIKHQFKKSKYLKIRFLDLHSYETTDTAAKQLAQLVDATVVDTRGKTCVLKRKFKPSDPEKSVMGER